MGRFVAGDVVSDADFAQGKLIRSSNIRPNRLFTADSNIVLYKAGALHRAKLAQAIAQIVSLLQK